MNWLLWNAPQYFCTSQAEWGSNPPIWAGRQQCLLRWRKKGWRTGRIASRSRLNTREAACWLGQRESSSRPTTLLSRHRLIFSSKFDWFFASNPLILHCQSFIFFILLVAISIIRCSLRSTSNQSWGGSKLSHQQSLDLPLPGQQVEKGGKD